MNKDQERMKHRILVSNPVVPHKARPPPLRKYHPVSPSHPDRDCRLAPLHIHTLLEKELSFSTLKIFPQRDTVHSLFYHECKSFVLTSIPEFFPRLQWYSDLPNNFTFNLRVWANAPLQLSIKNFLIWEKKSTIQVGIQIGLEILNWNLDNWTCLLGITIP